MKCSGFRAWSQNKWMEYKRERFEWDNIVVRDPPEVYFARYKWWLKEMYKEECRVYLEAKERSSAEETSS